MSEIESASPIRVTISDPDSGKILEERIIENDYCLIVAGNRYVRHVQICGQTHTISISESLYYRSKTP